MKIELIRKGDDYLIRRRLLGFIPLWWCPYARGRLRSRRGAWQFSCDCFCRLDQGIAIREFKEFELTGNVTRRLKQLDKEFRKAKGEIVEVTEA